MFILLAGVTVMVRLFHTSLRYSTLVDNQSIATVLAERQMEKVRGWSRTIHLTQPFSNWATCPGLGMTSTDTDFPGFEIKVGATLQKIYSPCSLFESLFPASEQRTLNASTRKVTVSVYWGDQLEYDLVSLVSIPTGEPPNPATATVNAGTGTLSQGSRTSVSVSATNSLGQPLPDLFFNYIIQPGAGNTGGGNGALDVARDGRTVTMRHCIYDLATPVPNITGYGVGTCTVRVLALYRGKPVQGATANIDMQP
ncbi:hypothetical protein JST97_22920 [bacterium]|nr:hypothetical protein [bacterium]